MIKQLLKRSPFVTGYLQKKRLENWVRDRPPTEVSHDVKQLGILYHAIANRLDVLVETGTYLGDMVWAQKDYFRKIYSIELSEDLFARAVKRFARISNVELYQGDSSQRINDVLSKLSGPALFWLDGHYSGGITAKGDKVCPIYGELDHIFRSSFEHVILVDDARLFAGEDDYPTLAELAGFVSTNSKYEMRVENDMIILSLPAKKFDR